MAPLPRDPNRVPVVGGIDTTDGKTPVPMEVDSVTGELLTKQIERAPTDSSKANASLTISNADGVEASTKVYTKTIGATSYQKTISYNAAGDVIAISAWS